MGFEEPGGTGQDAGPEALTAAAFQVASKREGERGKSQARPNDARAVPGKEVVSQLSLHSTSAVAVIAVLGIVGLRLVFKTAKLGLLLVAPALLYLLHLH